jgi:TM2 domain-containing membrane protein YozV
MGFMVIYPAEKGRTLCQGTGLSGGRGRMMLARPDRGGAMSIYTLLMTLITVGVILWAINTYIPMDGKIKSILNAVVVILVLLWLLQLFSGYNGFPRIWVSK